MFEKEEEKLQELKQHLDVIEIPSNIDTFIQSGIKAAKGKKRKSRSFQWRSLVASLLLISTLLTMINVSTSFAGYLSNIPGLEKIVEIVRFDKGLLSAIENDFMQPVGVSDEHNGLMITVDSVIVDEEKMVLFYTVKSNSDIDHLMLNDIKLLDTTSNQELQASISIGSIPLVKGVPSTGTIDFHIKDLRWPTSMTLSFTMNEEQTDNSTHKWELPFTIDIDQYTGMKEEYVLNETVPIQNQLITVQKIIVFPTRIGIHLLFDPKNNTKIFNFDDLRIVDEDGEQWGSISNGVSATHLNDNEWIVFLESNYFKKQKELYLEFSSVRAIKKEELEVVVNVDQQKIVKAPSDGRILSVETTGNDLTFVLMKDPNLDQRYTYSLFEGEFIDANGVGFSAESHFAYNQGDSDTQISGVVLPTLDFQNPITLTLSDYPSRLKEKEIIRIQIK